MAQIRLKFRLIKENLSGIKNANRIFEKHLRVGLEAAGKRLQRSMSARMRKDTGKSRKSLVIRIQGRGMALNMFVFSSLLSAYIDGMGLRPGVMPNFSVGSPLYKWVSRKMRGGSSASVKVGSAPEAPKVQKIKRVGSARQVAKPSRYNTQTRRLTFLVARTIKRRGIRATNWNTRALEASRGAITRELENAMARAINEINRGTA